ncbi:MAG: DUF488 domain-containing protein [Nitrosotalea sp.]
MIKIKRIYEPVSKEDGFRILVDRLWPRGVSKESAQIDMWLKEVAPSDSLRKWFSHDPKKWIEFKKRYHEEMKEKKDAISNIRSLEKEKRTITLLYSAKDMEYNNAIFLQEYLRK